MGGADPLKTGALVSESAIAGKAVPEADGRILGLLRGAGGALGLHCISYVLEIPVDEVRHLLDRMTSEGLLERRLEHHSAGWREAEGAGDDPGLSPVLAWRLLEFALSTPSASLSELICAVGQDIGELTDRMNLLQTTMHAARENGEFRIVASLADEMMRSSGDSLPESRLLDVLRIMDPRKLRELDNRASREFVATRIDTLTQPSGRILALTRLGELEITANHLPKAEMFLKDALDRSMKGEVGEWVPEILDNLADLAGDFEKMRVTADLIHEVIAWTPALADDDQKVRIMATAAAALAKIQRFKAAEISIQSAMSLVPQVSPGSRMVLEWCRARIHIASGRPGAAVRYLERALLLAENINDQVSVSEILDLLVFTMRSQPGYTIRSLTAIMERVSGRATTTGNISNQLYSLNHLADMYLRTLQLDGLVKVHGEIQRLAGTAGIAAAEPAADWCCGFMGYMCRRNLQAEGQDPLIPGSVDFFMKLADGIDPMKEARVIGEYLIGRQKLTSFAYGLFMAMEAFAVGYGKAANSIAAPLQMMIDRISEDPEPSWKLCISAILAEDPQDADDFFSSAQVLARQMDRLLLVWLILRCRYSLDIRREQRELVGIDLLLLELEQYIAQRIPEEDRERYDSLDEVRDRRERMERMSLRSGPAAVIRDAVEILMVQDSGISMEKVDRLSSRFSSRSEISWSLEALGTITGACRIQAIQVKNGDLKIIESYGLGRERLPGQEAADLLRTCPDATIAIDDFGTNPFGCRRFSVIPTSMKSEKIARERRTHGTRSEVDSYILIEADSPFDTIGSAGFMVSCFVRQIGSALLLRERETQSYYDAMTGAAIRSSWMKKLGELLEASVTPGTPLSVLLLDIDRFKRVNDTFGHREGDRILREAVTAISSALRPNDIVGRIGGDEFGIALPSASSENAMTIADRICRKVSSAVFLPDQIPLTISIGVATVEAGGSPSDLVISRADAALYQSKEDGRNRVTQWTTASDAAGEDRRRFSILDTGDPGWDHIIGQTVMELLSAKRDDITLELLAGRLRDVLRCEYLFLEDATGDSAGVGPSFARRVRELVPRGYPGRISEHTGLLGRFHALSSLLVGGGWLLAAWEVSDRLPVSIRGVFTALSTLSDLLMSNR